jgi:hypothetical protein
VAAPAAIPVILVSRSLLNAAVVVVRDRFGDATIAPIVGQRRPLGH